MGPMQVYYLIWVSIWRTGTGIFMIGRLPGLISHVYEEKVREPDFRKFFDADGNIYYDGFFKIERLHLLMI